MHSMLPGASFTAAFPCLEAARTGHGRLACIYGFLIRIQHPWYCWKMEPETSKNSTFSLINMCMIDYDCHDIICIYNYMLLFLFVHAWISVPNKTFQRRCPEPFRITFYHAGKVYTINLSNQIIRSNDSWISIRAFMIKFMSSAGRAPCALADPLPRGDVSAPSASSEEISHSSESCACRDCSFPWWQCIYTWIQYQKGKDIHDLD